MTKLKRFQCAVVIFLGAFANLAFANSGKITFLEPASSAGKIGATISYKTPNNKDDSCLVVGTVSHPKGTDPNVKAAQLASDINNQCPDMTATANGATVTVTSASGYTITEIKLTDETKQKTNINPKSLTDGKLDVVMHLEGTSTGGTAMVSLDNCGSSSSTSTTGKTGYQIAADLAAGLTNCDASNGSVIYAVNLGGGIGELRLFGLSNANSVVTISSGGDNGISETIIMRPTIGTPTLSEWGMIIMTTLLLTGGAIAVWQRGKLIPV